MHRTAAQQNHSRSAEVYAFLKLGRRDRLQIKNLPEYRQLRIPAEARRKAGGNTRKQQCGISGTPVIQRQHDPLLVTDQPLHQVADAKMSEHKTVECTLPLFCRINGHALAINRRIHHQTGLHVFIHFLRQPDFPGQYRAAQSRSPVQRGPSHRIGITVKPERAQIAAGERFNVFHRHIAIPLAGRIDGVTGIALAAHASQKCTQIVMAKLRGITDTLNARIIEIKLQTVVISTPFITAHRSGCGKKPRRTAQHLFVIQKPPNNCVTDLRGTRLETEPRCVLRLLHLGIPGFRHEQCRQQDRHQNRNPVVQRFPGHAESESAWLH